MSNQLIVLPIWVLPTGLFILGAIWGSFVAALCSRWPKGESVAIGRSRCDQCRANISAYDLIPIVSYLLLKAKCRNCGQAIGVAPIVTELAAASIGAIPLLFLPHSQAIAAAIFGWFLLPLVILDYRHLWLPDRLTILLAMVGCIVGPMLSPSIDLVDRMIGLMAGFLSLEIVRQVYKQLRRHDGMGAGDPKIFGVIGIWIGWQMLPITLLLAVTFGLVWVCSMRAVRRDSGVALPLGSYLAVAAYLVAIS